MHSHSGHGWLTIINLKYDMKSTKAVSASEELPIYWTRAILASSVGIVCASLLSPPQVCTTECSVHTDYADCRTGMGDAVVIGYGR